ncbi:E3 ubiquitin-protein like [Heracleum sosnowskyi]|uniref:E3 ubiquitin-protein like n=1 Tax=Heracleum sosnowskyi TaxID=360622 RepID=A0AAD8N5C3_9APIA|nr:E3 ubiquitin-protein like [Heracleum sosnowskyi]
MIGQSTNSPSIRHRKVARNPSNSFNLETQPVNETLAVDIESSGSNWSSNEVEIVVVKERVEENRDSPPSDDVCPICFGEFTVPVKTNCGHWFCGSCFLQFWNHKPSLRKCKCPMCSQLISKLTPEACLLNRHEKEVRDVLKNVHKYNCLFQGGFRGFVQNVFSLPLLTKKLLQGLMDPDRFRINYDTARCIGIMVGLMYQISPLDFIPTERHVAHNFFELCATTNWVLSPSIAAIAQQLTIRETYPCHYMNL